MPREAHTFESIGEGRQRRVMGCTRSEICWRLGLLKSNSVPDDCCLSNMHCCLPRWARSCAGVVLSPLGALPL